MSTGGRAVEDAFRDAWPVVVAATARFTRDLDLAEDCAQEALERALRSWDEAVPRVPQAWLITTARRIALDRLRRDTALRRKLPLLVEPHGGHADEDDADEDDAGVLAPEDPLRLVFLCCHPALSRESQVVLTLRLVCGLDVGAIAAVTLSGRAGVARRITRAKQKIIAARVPFRLPCARELSERLDAALTVVHLTHTAGHLAAHAHSSHGLRDDALNTRAVALARLLVRLLPDEPEPRGLLALITLTDARGPSRTGEDGEMVLLPDQDRSQWDRTMIAEGLTLATAALRGGRPGRFTLQAAVAGLHAVAPSWADTDWDQIVASYDSLMRSWPSPVVALNRAMARSWSKETDLPDILAELDALADQLPGYPYLPAARADVLRRLGRSDDAAHAYDQAHALTTNPLQRRYLDRQRSQSAR
ncbi:RNA polymerase sigma factor [Pseudonocardia sp. HH130630-07]|uniref:RNA polymerase sigma factor n=1 Tax=Pseudonocardia sp. HH130630-07 TaxID=1690815 RepID=UPI0008153AD2|nr:DUF6596 domain-containing protein [Pseudonocardia sp. HH130630-07]ANY06656.1 RNA polymerase subunit sigma-24 [Pseudonocardia sp. HH130630-07]